MKFKLSDNQTATSLAGETMILNHKAGEYFSLDEVGSFIWNEISESPKSIEEIEVAIKDNFEVDDCKSDVEELLGELIKNGLVEQVL